VFRRVGAEMVDVRRAATPTHLHLRERLVAIAAVSIVVDLAGSVLILLFERNAPRTQIHHLGDSLFWTTTQLLTVSSQLPNPTSTGGRITDVFLQLYAISVVATLAGALGAFFNRRSFERHPMTHHVPEQPSGAAPAGPQQP
jgi:hypothetical protein